jgi:hypothetical protein
MLKDTAFVVGASGYTYEGFTVPSGATQVKLQGHFVATGGSGNDIEAYVLTEDGFANWKAGHSANTFYNSGRVTQDTLNVSLPADAGKYYLLFSNKFSWLTPKGVQTSDMKLTFYGL